MTMLVAVLGVSLVAVCLDIRDGSSVLWPRVCGLSLGFNSAGLLA